MDAPGEHEDGGEYQNADAWSTEAVDGDEDGYRERELDYLDSQSDSEDEGNPAKRARVDYDEDSGEEFARQIEAGLDRGEDEEAPPAVAAAAPSSAMQQVFGMGELTNMITGGDPQTLRNVAATNSNLGRPIADSNPALEADVFLDQVEQMRRADEAAEQSPDEYHDQELQKKLNGEPYDPVVDQEYRN